MRRITLSHGSGGRLTWELVEEVFARHFGLSELEDAACVEAPSFLAVTTDSFVVRPIFFPGGDIGKLAVCGTLNDLAVSCAEPLVLTCSFILEEGLSFEDLERVVSSMAREAEAAGVRIVAGDTKVVEGSGGLIVNTTGIGRLIRRLNAKDVKPGDVVVVTGNVGRHGMSVFLARESVDVEAEVESDCANLWPLLKRVCNSKGLRWMRDATRGGLATVLVELSRTTGLGVRLYEESIPVDEDVAFLCDMFGFDPLYLACEGRAVLVVSEEDADGVLKVLRSHPLGEGASVIGRVTDEFSGVRLKTALGGERLLEYLEEDPLPRIC